MSFVTQVDVSLVAKAESVRDSGRFVLSAQPLRIDNALQRRPVGWLQSSSSENQT
jgi:hypothetical protein